MPGNQHLDSETDSRSLHLCCFYKLLSSHSSGRIVTLLAMPPTWVDFSWELVRDERDNTKQISVIVIGRSWDQANEKMERTLNECFV